MFLCGNDGNSRANERISCIPDLNILWYLDLGIIVTIVIYILDKIYL